MGKSSSKPPPPSPSASDGAPLGEAHGEDRVAQYIAAHSLTIHLKTKYPAAFREVEAVRIRPVVGVDPSSWPMVSATGLPRDVPRHLVKAHALLRWSVHEIHPDPAALDSADRIIQESCQKLLADIGLKHTLAGKKGQAQQKKGAADRRTAILSTFDQLQNELPANAKIEPIVVDTASKHGCDPRTVWRALEWRKKKLTDKGADCQ